MTTSTRDNVDIFMKLSILNLGIAIKMLGKSVECGRISVYYLTIIAFVVHQRYNINLARLTNLT